MVKEDHYLWIDFLKGIAILAVVMNHLYNIAFSNQKILLLTAYSVTLFVALAGITASISINRKETIDWNYLKGRLLSILVPYIIAVLACHLYTYKGQFDLNLYLQKLTSFSFPTYYFVAFFIQLILVSTILVKVFDLCRNSIIKQAALLVIIYFICVVLERFTLVKGMLLGSTYILGGSYLFVYCLGILFYYNRDKFNGKKINIALFIISIVGIIIFIIKNYLIYTWHNPPVKYTILYSILIFFLFYAPFKILEERVWNNKFTRFIGDLGKNSLYIFLYHFLFITIATDVFFKETLIEGSIVYRLWVTVISIFPAYFISKFLRPCIKKAMFYKNTAEIINKKQ